MFLDDHILYDMYMNLIHESSGLSLSTGDTINFDAFFSKEALSKPFVWGSPLKYDFAVAHPDPRAFPIQDMVKAALSSLEKSGREIAPYPPSMGSGEIRRLIAAKIWRAEKIDIPIERIVATNGSTQGLHMVADTFINHGDMVLTEEFTYYGALRAFRRLEPRLVGIPIDSDGIIVEEVESAIMKLKAGGVTPKLIYTTPNFQNPTGGMLSLSRRKKLIEVTEKYGIPVIEDDAYGDLVFDGDLLPSLYSIAQRDSTIRLGSFSKVIGAGIRLGWVIAPSQVVQKMLITKTIGVNTLASLVIEEYLKEHMEARLAFARSFYREKRDAMMEALERHIGSELSWAKPKGGVFLWAHLGDNVNPQKLLEIAQGLGVNFILGKHFAYDGRDVPYIRLSYAYPSVEDIDKGIQLLAEAVRTAKVLRAAVVG